MFPLRLRRTCQLSLTQIEMCSRLLSAVSQPASKDDPERNPVQKKESNSFVMNMFKGHFKGEQVFPFPHVLTDDQEQNTKLMIDPVEKFFEEVNDPMKNDQLETVEEKTLKGLREIGAFGIQIPIDYGGLGLGNTQYARLGEVLGFSDLGISIFLGAHQSIGLKGILLFGNEAQKKKYLPDLASGKHIAAYCLTEPGSGSDASSIKSRAEISQDGRHFILNGSKIWISNGGIADIFTVFAQTPIKTPDGEREKITAFIIERAFEGVRSGPPEKKMGIKASNTAEVFFEDVKVPIENVLGEVGEGFKVAMNILNSGRFGMAAAMTGCMRKVIDKTIDHATNRVQFGNKISSYGAIQEKIARMAMAHYISETLTYMVSGLFDQGFKDCQLEAAISKVYASEAAWFVVDEGIQTLGGMGYMREGGLEKIMRDLRIFRIFEGTNDILRLFIALTGLQNAGGHLKELQSAMKNPAANLGLIFDEGTKRVKRAVGLSTAPSLIEFVHPNLLSSANLVSKSIETFGESVEYLLIKHGKNIVNEQFLLNRLTSAAIDIYNMVIVLSRASETIEKQLPSAKHEQDLATVICSEGADRAQQNLLVVRKGDKVDNFKTMAAISESLCENGGISASRLLGF